jgi:hypothetical protein
MASKAKVVARRGSGILSAGRAVYVAVNIASSATASACSRLEARNFGDGVLEAVFAEQLVRLVLELIAQFCVAGASHDVAERGEQDGS